MTIEFVAMNETHLDAAFALTQQVKWPHRRADWQQALRLGEGLVAVEKGRVIAAGWSGKVKTASTMVCICLMLFGIPQVLNYVCQGVILVTTVYSGVEYFAKNWDVFKES